MGKILKAIALSLFWNIMITIFSFLQVGIILLISMIINDMEFNINTLFTDGVFVFFCATLVMSITFDYYFSKNVRVSKLFEVCFFVVLPIIILTLGIVIYICCYIKSNNNIDKDIVIGLEYIMLFITMFDSLIIKGLLIYDRKESVTC